MPLDTTVVVDTVWIGRRAWVHMTRVVHDTLYVPYPDSVWVVQRSEPPSELPAWIGWTITASAAVLAGVIAQAFRVWLDKRTKRRFLVNELFTDFAVLERMTEVLANQYRQDHKVQADSLAIIDFVLGNFERLRQDLVLLRWDYCAWITNFYRELTAARRLLQDALDEKLSAGELDRVEYELRQVADHFGDYPNIFDRVKEAYDREIWLEIWWETITEPIRSWMMARSLIPFSPPKRVSRDPRPPMVP